MGEREFSGTARGYQMCSAGNAALTDSKVRTADTAELPAALFRTRKSGLEIGKRPARHTEMIFHDLTECAFEYLSRLKEPDQITCFLSLIGTV